MAAPRAARTSASMWPRLIASENPPIRGRDESMNKSFNEAEAHRLGEPNNAGGLWTNAGLLQ